MVSHQSNPICVAPVTVADWVLILLLACSTVTFFLVHHALEVEAGWTPHHVPFLEIAMVAVGQRWVNPSFPDKKHCFEFGFKCVRLCQVETKMAHFFQAHVPMIC